MRFPATPGWGPLAAMVCGVRRWCVGGVVAGVWCGWSLATPGGGSCVLLPATPGWVSLPVVVRGPRHSWLRVPGAVPRHSWRASAGGGGVWCAAVVCWWGCGWCVVWLVPRHSWRRFLCATPRHSWLGFAAGGGGRSSPLLAEGPGRGSPPPLAGVRWRRWCVVCGGGVFVGLWLVCGVVGPSPLLAEVLVCYSPPLLARFCCLVVGVPRHSWRRVPGAVPRHSWLGFAVGGGVWCVVCGVLCGGGVLVGLWLVCGVVGPSPLLAEVPVCYSPPLLARFRCRWWWAFLATPGGGSRVRFPATPGWGPLAAVVCGVRRWCVGWVVAGVWCGWSLATPGGGSGVLLPATPGSVLLPGGGRSSPLLAEGPRRGSPPLLAGFRCRRWCVVCGVWCVVCGGGVLVGLWLVCGVVGPSPLLAEVPVCYSPPLLARFRCRWWCAVLATPG